MISSVIGLKEIFSMFFDSGFLAFSELSLHEQSIRQNSNILIGFII